MIFSLVNFAKPMVKSSLIVSGVLGLLIANPVLILGQSKPIPNQKKPPINKGVNYQPSSTQTPPNTSSNKPITRGPGSCSEITGIPLTLITHNSFVGQTISSHPTFAWFAPNSPKSISMEFVIFESNSKAEVYKTQNLSTIPNSRGIMTLSLPKNTPGLAEGKTYIWQVSLLCNENSPSQDIVIQATVERLKPSLPLNNLQNLNDSQKLDKYLEAGLWYDSFSTVLTLDAQSKTNKQGEEVLKKFLEVEENQSTKKLSKKKQEYINQSIKNLKEITSIYNQLPIRIKGDQ